MAPLLFNDPMPLVAQMVKRLTAMWDTRETWVQSLGGEDPLE